ncbi:MAG: hypothetical protein SGJ05_04585 [bacterium]|nr:hypothetical protein [bacterium]
MKRRGITSCGSASDSEAVYWNRDAMQWKREAMQWKREAIHWNRNAANIIGTIFPLDAPYASAQTITPSSQLRPA